MTKICFVDCETQSLRPDRRAWEIGLIVRRPVIVKHPDRPDTTGTEDVEHLWLIDSEDLDLGNADPFSLKVGRFYERHPQYQLDQEAQFGECESEYDALRSVEAITRGAHLVGAVPNFDADVLGTRMRAHGICPSWHYHLCCIENLAAGCLSAHAALLEREGASERARKLREIASPPWNSDELSRAVGVEPDESARHTALGDAAWARDVYDAVMGGAR